MATDMMTQLTTLVRGGMPPEQAIQLLRDAQAQEFAKMPTEQKLSFNVGRAASRVGQGLLRSAGIEDPMLAQASKIRELSAQFDTNTVEGMKGFANAVRSINPNLAEEASKKAREMELTEAKIGSEKALATQREREKQGESSKDKFIREVAGKVTPQSLQTFSETGRYQDLVYLTKDEKTTKPPADFLAVAVELGYGEKNSFGDYSSEQVKNINQTLLDRSVKTRKAGVSEGTNVYVDTMGKKAAESAGAAGGKAVGEATAQIQGKEDALTAVGSALDLLKSGIYAGGYGPMQAAVAKYTPLGSKGRLQNTEQFISTIGEVVIPRLQEFGGNDSVEELKYLRSVVGGEITYEEKTLKRILESAQRKIKRGIDRVQQQQKAVQEGKPLPTDVKSTNRVNWNDLK